MLDEVTDARSKEHVSLFLMRAHVATEIAAEMALQIKIVSKVELVTLAQIVQDFLYKNVFPVSMIVGQSCDGEPVMKGFRNGLDVKHQSMVAHASSITGHLVHYESTFSFDHYLQLH